MNGLRLGRLALFTAAAGVLTVSFGCHSEGSEGGPCHPSHNCARDGTCDGDLVCNADDTCVAPETAPTCASSEDAGACAPATGCVAHPPAEYDCDDAAVQAFSCADPFIPPADDVQLECTYAEPFDAAAVLRFWCCSQR